MRRTLLLFTLFFSLSLFSFAQDKIVIDLNGEKIEYPVWKITSMSFEKIQPESSQLISDSVDLDLPSGVKWARFNIKANGAEGNTYFGWGNPIFSNHATDNKFFPTFNIKSNITGTDYDIAKTMWGDKWRMPTVADFNELIANCDWSWDETEMAWKVASKTNPENYIYLPLTGKRVGEVTDSETEAYYWTGDIDSGDNAKAQYFFFSNENDSEKILSAERYSGFAIRPVFGEYKSSLIPYCGDAEMTSSNSCAIIASVEGNSDDVQFGVVYSVSKDNLTLETANSVKTTKNVDKKATYRCSLNNLEYLTTYYYKAFAAVGQDVYYEEEVHSFVTSAKYPVPTKENGDPDYADLGLGVKWARYNMGASSPLDYGDFFCWGDPDGEGSYGQYLDLEDISGTEYDVVHNCWKGEWRMPTVAEWKELLDNCEIEFTILKNSLGKNVYGITCSRNGDSIFIPYSGRGDKMNERNSAGFYWTSNQDHHAEYFALIEYPNNVSGETSISFLLSPSYQFSIRPVYGAYDPNSFITPTEPTEPDDDNPGQGTGEEDDKPEVPETEEKVNEEAVDLGLSVLWANKNVGANTIYDCGSYFAWGETEERDNYLQSNYAYYVDNKYQDVGTGKTSIDIAGSEYDAAYVNWGGTWRMPTHKEFKELLEECKFKYETVNGVCGLTVTGPNGNSIFLPASSFKNGLVTGELITARYWSSSFYIYDDDRARFSYALYFDEYGQSTLYNNRYFGCTIRPVKNK